MDFSSGRSTSTSSGSNKGAMPSSVSATVKAVSRRRVLGRCLIDSMSTRPNKIKNIENVNLNTVEKIGVIFKNIYNNS